MLLGFQAREFPTWIPWLGLGRFGGRSTKITHEKDGRSHACSGDSERVAAALKVTRVERFYHLHAIWFADRGGCNRPTEDSSSCPGAGIVIYHGPWFFVFSPLFWCAFHDDYLIRWYQRRCAAALARVRIIFRHRDQTAELSRTAGYNTRLSSKPALDGPGPAFNQPAGSYPDLCPPDRGVCRQL